MSSYILLNKYVTEFTDIDRSMIRSELIEASEGTDIIVDPEELTGESTTLFNLDMRYEWEIDIGNGTYILTEKRLVDRKWYYIFLLLISFIATALLILSIVLAIGLKPPVIPGKTILYSYFILETALRFTLMLTIASLVLAVIVFSVFVLNEGLVPKTRGANEGFSSDSPWLVPTILSGVALVVGSFGMFLDYFFIVLFSSLFSYYLVWKMLSDWKSFEDSSEFLSSGFVPSDSYLMSGFGLDIKRRYQNGEDSKILLPVVATEYILDALPLCIPGLSLVIVAIQFGYFGMLLFGILVLPFIYYLMNGFSSKISGDYILDTIYDVKQNKRRETRRPLQIFWFLLTIFVSYSLLGTLLGVLLLFSDILIQPLQPISLTALIISVISLILYFVIGLLYQVSHTAKSYYKYFRYSSPTDREFQTSAKVMVLDLDEKSPFALSTGFEDYIFLPSKLVDKLNSEELEAVVAHEEKHIQTNEALLVFMMPLLSIFLFTGQNVLFSLLNFREREFKADKHAGQKVGKEVTISALKKIASHSGQDNNKETTWWQEYFGLFYGTFAQSQAHPSVDERLDYLNEEFSSTDRS